MSRKNKEEERFNSKLDELFGSEVITRQKVDQCYKDIASIYDQVLDGQGQIGPAKVASKLAEMFPKMKEWKSLKVLDIGAGTGRIGIHLDKLGFQKIHALEPCREMLEVLLKKDVYRGIFVEYLGEMNSLDFADGEYDAVVMSGAFDMGHLSVKAPREIARIIKKGGYLVNAITLEKFSEDYDQAVEDEMMLMDKEGTWSLVERQEYQHRKDIGGICYTFRRN